MPSLITLSLEEKLRNSSDRTAGRGFGRSSVWFASRVLMRKFDERRVLNSLRDAAKMGRDWPVMSVTREKS